MISNLISSLLIATAVGGTTATAFGNEPSKAISVEQEQITTSDSTYQTAMNIGINVNDIQPIEMITTDHNYKTYNQSLTNNSVMQITSSIYINNLTTYTAVHHSYIIGDIISIYKLDMYNQFIKNTEVFSQRVNVYMNQTDNTASVRLSEGYSYAVLNTQTTNAYDNLVNRVIRSDTDWTTLMADVEFAINSATEKTVNQSQMHTASGQINENIMNPSYYNVLTEGQHNIIIVKQHFVSKPQTGTNAPTESQISYTSSLTELVFSINQSGYTMEVVPIIPMMYTILTMPFSFISQAFNLTFFAGTPYAINMADLILVVLSVLVILLLVRIIFKFLR